MIQIRNCDTGSLILEVKTLRRANLRFADLRNANLQFADLSGANLEAADLRSAALQLADLSGADLSGANLEGADLRGADLRDTDLLGANLRGVTWPQDLIPLSKEQEEKNLQLVAALALNEGALKMNRVHSCETTHCIAGWATHALPGGAALEKKYSWTLAGFHLLGAEASKMFHASEEDARSFLKQYLVNPVDA